VIERELWEAPVRYSRPSIEEDKPMTLHLMLLTTDADGCPDGFVWAVDRKVGEQWGDAEKIAYLESHNVACSAWGNRALRVRDEFIKRIKNGHIKLNVPGSDSNQEHLTKFVQEMAGDDKTSGGGLIVALFGNGLPVVYRVEVTYPVIPVHIEYYNLFAGDDHNPAQIFATYYHANKSSRSLPETLLMAVHTMRLARTLKLYYLGDPSVWFYSEGKFQRLSHKQLAAYTRMSAALDECIIKKLRSIVPKREISSIEKLLREKA
jgi:hypothetical protein